MSKDAQKRAQNTQARQSASTRLAFLAAAGMILAIEIYIAICVKGGFVRHYAGDVLAVILLYALTRAAFGAPPLNLPLKIFAFAAVLELAQYLGAVQKMTEVMAKFVGYTGKMLPDDVTAKRQTPRQRHEIRLKFALNFKF